MLLEPGRVCIKKFGRDAGSRAVVMEVGKDGFVKILTAVRSNKERRCNPSHLEFLDEVVDIKSREAINKTLGVKEQKAHAQPKAKK
ncbi:MAG: 50S ribosomal protein L14e [Candidatus Micrarchaeota archaeon]|nr:50S ribosomal protein L14e [Candidatus Micrarchaeota archaeon]